MIFENVIAYITKALQYGDLGGEHVIVKVQSAIETERPVYKPRAGKALQERKPEIVRDVFKSSALKNIDASA